MRDKGHEWVPNPPELSQISAAAVAQCGTTDAPAQDLPEAYHMGGRLPELQGGLVLRKCAAGANRHSHRWYRWFNEIPIVLLTAAVLLVVLKPL